MDVAPSTFTDYMLFFLRIFIQNIRGTSQTNYGIMEGPPLQFIMFVIRAINNLIHTICSLGFNSTMHNIHFWPSCEYMSWSVRSTYASFVYVQVHGTWNF